MKYCWNHVDKEVGPAAPGFAMFGVICLGAMFAEAFGTSEPLKYLLTVGIIGIPVVAFVLFVSIVSARRYRIDAEGMTVRYPFGLTIRYRWAVFSEIAICKIHYASAGNAHIVAIRCVVGEEKHGPKHAVVGKGSWTRRRYEILRFRKVISIYKTDEREAEFRRFCPISIVDYRHLADRL